MNLTYRIGLPFWKLLARNNCPMKVRINVMHDEDAHVFVATSKDLPGLMVEAATMDQLTVECRAAVADLLTEALHQPIEHQPITDLRMCAT